MKPFHLPGPSIPRPPVVEYVKKAYQNNEGEIDSDAISASSCVDILKHLEDCGYKQRECQKYSPLTLTYVNGSCRWHDDHGFGLVACWLLYSENFMGDDAQLITRHGPLDMREGDLCVFDANQGHAWISNGVCVMFMATVKRSQRSRRVSTERP